MHRPKVKNAPAILLAIVLISLFAFLLGWSRLLSIRSIEISAGGNEVIITSIVEPSLARVGLPMARVSSERIRREILHQTWVANVIVNRRWLARDLRINVTSRVPVAQYVDLDGSTKYFDRSGYTFVTPHPMPALPVVTFTGSTGTLRSAIAQFLSAAPADLVAHMSSLEIDAHGNISMAASISGHSKLLIAWGTRTEEPLKVQVIQALLALKENKNITVIDVTNPLSPIVK